MTSLGNARPALGQSQLKLSSIELTSVAVSETTGQPLSSSERHSSPRRTISLGKVSIPPPPFQAEFISLSAVLLEPDLIHLWSLSHGLLHATPDAMQLLNTQVLEAGRILAFPLLSCVDLNHSAYPSGPYFLHLYHDAHGTYLQ